MWFNFKKIVDKVVANFNLIGYNYGSIRILWREGFEVNVYNILIVDNSKNSREFVGYVLKEQYEVFYAQNCAEALEIVNSTVNIHCILLDLAMPEKDGFKFLNRLRQIKLKNFVPVIILTEEPREVNEKNALMLDACDYIEKPFDVDVLKMKIHNVICKNDVNHQELKYLNAFDSLTNIYNKKYFFNVTKKMLTLFRMKILHL